MFKISRLPLPQEWNPEKGDVFERVTSVEIDKSYQNVPLDSIPALYAQAGLIEGYLNRFGEPFCFGEFTLVVTNIASSAEGSLYAFGQEDYNLVSDWIDEVRVHAKSLASSFKGTYTITYKFHQTFEFVSKDGSPYPLRQ